MWYLISQENNIPGKTGSSFKDDILHELLDQIKDTDASGEDAVEFIRQHVMPRYFKEESLSGKVVDTFLPRMVKEAGIK
jgi:hypothetical protein